jgi:hypothetical protein
MHAAAQLSNVHEPQRTPIDHPLLATRLVHSTTPLAGVPCQCSSPRVTGAQKCESTAEHRTDVATCDNQGARCSTGTTLVPLQSSATAATSATLQSVYGQETWGHVLSDTSSPVRAHDKEWRRSCKQHVLCHAHACSAPCQRPTPTCPCRPSLTRSSLPQLPTHGRHCQPHSTTITTTTSTAVQPSLTNTTRQLARTKREHAQPRPFPRV